MSWWQNIPFISVMACLLSAAFCLVIPPRVARIWVRSTLSLCAAGAGFLLWYLMQSGAGSFTYMMGHFPAPWGNELRCGILEAFLACLFPVIMLCALLAGHHDLADRQKTSRESLYGAVCMLLSAALFAQIYSNDLFTCYVFLEIMTLSAGALIVFRNTGKALAAGIRYMVLNLVGSGLFLLGVVLLYDLTGHLLMENLHFSIQDLSSAEKYHRSMTIIIALFTVGLAVKSALFPFHSWVPEAYSSGVSASNAIVSSLVSKGYIILLLKIYSRVLGWDLIRVSHVDQILLILSLSGMIFGSLGAIRTVSFTRMIAWSSVAQIGYIYLGIALGAGYGYQAALFHLIVHACSKSLLFLSGAWLKKAAGDRDDFPGLSGAARKCPVAGICWTVAAFSMVGLPFTGGLISKLLLGVEAMRHSWLVTLAVLSVLALSTLLNVLYFLRTVITLWSPVRTRTAFPCLRIAPAALGACSVLALAILSTFFFSSPLLQILSLGLAQF